jgi:hypothetical protein
MIKNELKRQVLIAVAKLLTLYVEIFKARVASIMQNLTIEDLIEGKCIMIRATPNLKKGGVPRAEETGAEIRQV